MRRVRGSHSISIERLSSTSISDALLNKSQGARRTKQDRSHNGSRPLRCDERLMRHSAINGLDCVLCDDEVVARQPAMTLATVSESIRGLFIIPPPPPAGC